MEAVIKAMLTADEHDKFQKHISFMPEVVEDNVLIGMAVASQSGAGKGLLLGTQNCLLFIIVPWANFGKAMQHHRTSFEEIEWANASERRLTVRKKTGFFKQQSYKLLSEDCENFVEALFRQLNIDTLEAEVEAQDYIPSGPDTAPLGNDERDVRAKRQDDIIYHAGAYHYLQEKEREEEEAEALEEAELAAEAALEEMQSAVAAEDLPTEDPVDEIQIEEATWERQSGSSDDTDG